MAKLNINNGGVDTNKKIASIDERYGPYETVAAANAALGASGRDCITAGLTVGIAQQDGSVKEYWYQPHSGQLSLVEKIDDVTAIKAHNAVSFAESQTLTDAQRNTALANVSNQTADSETGKMGYKVLNASLSFASQVTAENTIYEIKDVFDLQGGNVSMPSNSTLKFNGGKIVGCDITFNDTSISGNARFENCIATGIVKNKEIFVDWFAFGDGETDDSQAMLNAVSILNRNGGTLVFGSNKNYLHGDGLEGNSGTGNSYVADQSEPRHFDTNYPANIGRDITLRFLGCDGVTIEGNGSTIVSNESNGICKHNCILFLGACTNSTIRNLKLDGKRLERITNAGVHFNDYSTGSYSGYTGSIVDNWKNNVWVDSENKGYNLTSSFYIIDCQNIKVENIDSSNAIMDGVFINKAENHGTAEEFSHDIKINGGNYDYNARCGVALGQGYNIVVEDVSFYKNGYYSDGTIDNISSTNHAGFSSELESDTLIGLKNQVEVVGCSFYYEGINYSSGTSNSLVTGCAFHNGATADFPQLSAGSAETAYRLSENNLMEGCKMHNGRLGLKQSGLTIDGSTFTFDKYFDGSVKPYMIYTSGFSSVNNPIKFTNNTIDVDLSGMTTDVGGTTYIDSDLTSGQGRFFLVGNVIMEGNTFNNIAPSLKNYELFNGHSADYFYIIYANTKVFSENKFNFDVGNIRYKNGADVYVNTGIFRLQNYLLKSSGYECKGNSVTGNTSLTNSNINEKGGSADEPDFTSLFNNIENNLKFLENLKGFEYYNTDFNKKVYFNTYRTTKGASAGYNGNVNPYRYLKNSDTTQFSDGDKCYVSIQQFSDNNVPKIFLCKNQSLTDAKELATTQTVHSVTVTSNQAECYFVYDSTYPYIAIQKNNISTTNVFFFSKIDTRWVDGDGFSQGRSRGSTANRPSNLLTIDSGYRYYDTTLGKYICWNGTTWINIDGTALS